MSQSDNLDKKAIPLWMIRTNVKLAESLGFTKSMVLAGSDISVSDIDDTEQRVSYRQRIQVLENILRLVNQPDYWLARQEDVSIADFGLLGYAMVKRGQHRILACPLGLCPRWGLGTARGLFCWR